MSPNRAKLHKYTYMDIYYNIIFPFSTYIHTNLHYIFSGTLNVFHRDWIYELGSPTTVHGQAFRYFVLYCTINIKRVKLWRQFFSSPCRRSMCNVYCTGFPRNDETSETSAWNNLYFVFLKFDSLLL